MLGRGPVLYNSLDAIDEIVAGFRADKPHPAVRGNVAPTFLSADSFARLYGVEMNEPRKADRVSPNHSFAIRSFASTRRENMAFSRRGQVRFLNDCDKFYSPSQNRAFAPQVPAIPRDPQGVSWGLVRQPEADSPDERKPVR